MAVVIREALGLIIETRDAARRCRDQGSSTDLPSQLRDKLIRESGLLASELEELRCQFSPSDLGSVRITLGRSDSIAKFFAFNFVNQDFRDLEELTESPFFGSGVYAIYYRGVGEVAYSPLSGTETPIYVGKANPENPYAETVEEQGRALFKRLKEHAKNISNTELSLSDFQYRYAAIQTGMQASVEEFMIRLFRPIWNKEMKLCFGIGKHGDSAKTRRNKRSPWDTMHPGRKWASDTKDDQMSRDEICNKVGTHFDVHPPVADKDQLFRMLSL